VEKCIDVFIDDLSVFGLSYESRLENLNKVLIRCANTNLVLNWGKCHFITKLPALTTVKGTRSFLRHAKFYIRFIRNFSRITKPLCNLLLRQ